MIDTILILLRDWTVILITGMIFWLWEIRYPLHEIKYKANFFRELGWAGISLVGVADFGYDFYLLAIAKLLHGQYFRLLDFYFHTLIQQRLQTLFPMVIKLSAKST
ncbi:MAG: hypothetical protein ACK4YK_07810 [Dolichospermum sp.]|jgi:hypothetical protein